MAGMSYITAFIIVVVSALVASCASLAVRRMMRIEARRRHHETGGALFLQLGVLFSVLLAFVFNEVWGEYNTASQAINGEVSALHGAAIVASTLPPAQAKTIERAILSYANTVTHQEWPAMAARQASPAAVQDFTSLVQQAARMDSPASHDATNQAQILTLLTDAHTQRETRIFQMQQGLPAALWLVLAIYTAVLIICVLLAAVETAFSHVVFAGAFTGCVMMVLTVVRMLDYPFEGALALANSDFEKLAREIAGLLAGA